MKGQGKDRSLRSATVNSSDDILNNILSEVQEIKTSMISRLTSMEIKMSMLVQTCNKISSRLDILEFSKPRLENTGIATGTMGTNQNQTVPLADESVSSNSEMASLAASLLGDSKSISNLNDIPQLTNYTVVISQNEPDTFQSNYGLTKTQFEGLLVAIGERYNLSNHRLPIETASLASLWTLCNQDSYRNIGDRFGICKGTISNVLHTFTSLVSEHLEHYIEWPRDKAAENTISKFSNLGFPNTVGAIDACHIQIDRPSEGDTPCPDNYFNRKSFFSTNLLAVCNPDLEFTFVHVGSPGKFNDAKVLSLSQLGEIIADYPNDHGIFPKGTYLIGDTAFPLSIYVMTPFRDFGQLTEREITYNHRLSSAQNVAKRGLSLLKRRFRRLRHLQMHTLAGIAVAIKTCCILHNICMEENDADYRLDEEDEEPEDEYFEATSYEDRLNPTLLQAEKFRYELAASLCLE